MKEKIKELEREKDFLERMLEDLLSKTCNNCKYKLNCDVMPDWGEQVRINCFMWEERK